METPIKRVMIEKVRPVVGGGDGYLSIRRAVGDQVRVKADLFVNGHDRLAGELLFRKAQMRHWQALPMAFINNHEWYSAFQVSEAGIYEYTVQAWIDRFRTWLADVEKKWIGGQNVALEMKAGSRIVAAAAALARGEAREWLVERGCQLGSDRSCRERMRIAGDPDLSRLMDAYSDKRPVSVYDQVLRVQVDPPSAPVRQTEEGIL